MKRKLEETARLIQSQKEQKKREAKSRTQSDVRYLKSKLIFYCKMLGQNFENFYGNKISNTFNKTKKKS